MLGAHAAGLLLSCVRLDVCEEGALDASELRPIEAAQLRRCLCPPARQGWRCRSEVQPLPRTPGRRWRRRRHRAAAPRWRRRWRRRWRSRSQGRRGIRARRAPAFHVSLAPARRRQRGARALDLSRGHRRLRTQCLFLRVLIPLQRLRRLVCLRVRSSLLETKLDALGRLRLCVRSSLQNTLALALRPDRDLVRQVRSTSLRLIAALGELAGLCVQQRLAPPVGVHLRLGPRNCGFVPIRLAVGLE
mmetsp:Transcript_4591/g.18407  ORF Transcript_4591/g.18407 Transcript_4591/m.18407 type:complete len:246 (-) Transcript_4591:1445-2182(-)